MPSLPPLPMAGETLDRVAERRSDAAWVEEQLHDPGSRLLLVEGERVPVDGDHLRFMPASELNGVEAVLLGLDARGHAVFAAEAASGDLVHLRDAAALLAPDEAGIAAHAVALLGWHRRHRHCAVCGAPTEMVEAGHMRRCTNPDDGSLHHPRTDPCVIVLVHDGDRVLLGRRPSFPERRYSVLAGFVEPGETLEAAVAREVEEESGVRVEPASIAYAASQPWPFPASLMLGFTAAARTTHIAPHDGELADVRWMQRDELRRAAGDGEVLLPPPSSIARHLLDTWLANGHRAT